MDGQTYRTASGRSMSVANKTARVAACNGYRAASDPNGSYYLMIGAIMTRHAIDLYCEEALRSLHSLQRTTKSSIDMRLSVVKHIDIACNLW